MALNIDLKKCSEEDSYFMVYGIEKILGLNIFNINASYDKNDNMEIDNEQNVKGDTI